MKLNPGLPWQKQHSKRRQHFSTPTGLNLRKKLENATFGAQLYDI
jgi:hypothetical protein